MCPLFHSSSLLLLIIGFLFVDISTSFKPFYDKETDITYPFAENGSRIGNCGDQGFELKCEYDYPVMVEIMSEEEYRVLKIDVENRNLTVVRTDIFRNDGCPGKLANTTLDFTLFDYATSKNLTFVSNCALGFTKLKQDNFTCRSDAAPPEAEGFYFDPTDPLRDEAIQSCKNITEVPILDKSLQDVRVGSLPLKDALRMGFGLKYTQDLACVKSRGECFYDSHPDAEGGELQLTGCYCAPKEDKIKKKVVLAISIGLPAILIIACCFFIRRHYKKKYASTMLARNISSRSDMEVGSFYFGASVFSYSELKEATNNFDIEKELGDGGFGTVYYGKLRDGREVAVKRLYEHNYRRVEQFMNEIEILTQLRHRNLVSLYGCTSRHSRELLLVYEYIPNGTVADHIHGDRATPGSPTWPTRMSIAIETASALAYLHASDIIHRDVKTNNILLDNSFCVKVADFGLSRLFPTNVTHVSTAPQGTPGYVDPEYHQCYQLTIKSDVYSFGVVLIELISSLPAVDITRHRHEINLSNLAITKIQNCEFNELIDQHLGFESDNEVKRMTIAVANLAFQCLQPDKETRPSMKEVLEVLKKIQSGEDVSEDRGKADDDAGVLKPPTSTDSDEIGLLKNTQLPPSPNSVTDQWTSRSTTPNGSGNGVKFSSI